jgi:hypothetical protein
MAEQEPSNPASSEVDDDDNDRVSFFEEIGVSGDDRFGEDESSMCILGEDN